MRRQLWIWIGIALLAAAYFTGTPSAVQAATITINSTADTEIAGDGDCTLREAITNANGDTDASGGDCTTGSGADTITFNIGGGGPQTIMLGSVLPIITDQLTIDGSSQPGFAGSLLINIDANGLSGNAMDARSLNSTHIDGLILNDFSISNAPDTALYVERFDNLMVDGMDVSLPSGATGYGIRAGGSNTLTIQNVTATHRNWGLQIVAVTDATVLNNTLSDNYLGLMLFQISAVGLPGGVLVSGNDFSNDANAISFREMSDLVISDGTVTGTNVILAASDGLDTVTGRVINLGRVDNTLIENVDLSLRSGAPAGFGVFADISIDQLSVQNVTANNRHTGVRVRRGTDIRVQDSTFRDDVTAVTLDIIAAGSLPGGVVVSGNDFSNSKSALGFSSMSDLIISDGMVAGTNVRLTPDDGLDTVTSNVITIGNVDNTLVDGVDFSKASGSPGGKAINATTSIDNLTVQNITASNRGGVSVSGGSDVRVLNNTLSDSMGGIFISGIISNNVPGGVLVEGNNLSNNKLGVVIANMSDLIISDGSVPGTHIKLAASDGLDTVYHTAIRLDRVDNTLIDGVDLSFAAGSPTGYGVRAINSIDGLTVQNVTVSNRATGIDVTNGSNLAVTCSAFLQNGMGMLTNISGAAVIDNHFEGNTKALRNNSVALLTAENNYWGAADGPSNLGGSGDSYDNAVDADPFLTSSPPCAGQISNQPPTLTVNSDPVTVIEGEVAANSGTVSDPDGDTVALIASAGLITNNNDGSWSWSFSTTDSQTITINAEDGSGGTGQATFELVVLTPQDAIEELIEDIEELEDQGRLHNGNGLIAKLRQIIAKLDSGNTDAACNQLGAVINQVNAFIAASVLEPSDGQDLLDSINRISHAIGCNPPSSASPSVFIISRKQ